MLFLTDVVDQMAHAQSSLSGPSHLMDNSNDAFICFQLVQYNNWFITITFIQWKLHYVLLSLL